MKKRRILISVVIVAVLLLIISFLIFDSRGYCLCLERSCHWGDGPYIGEKWKVDFPGGTREGCCPFDVECD